MDTPSAETEPQRDSLRERIWRVIFLSDTPAAKAFDVILLFVISASIIVVMLDSVASIQFRYGDLLVFFEWTFTIMFTAEYLIRVWCVRDRGKYIFSFFGIVDLLSILPTYLQLFLAGSSQLIVIRILRLLRMFRVLKMAQHIGQANVLLNALKASRSKISVFLFAVLSIVSIEGTLMYILESSTNPGFSNIPQSIYWGIVTVTTVGYGDIAPMTVAGKMLASVMMLTGFAIIAVPTGIVTAELHREFKGVSVDTRRCEECGHEGHDPAARYCKMCGTDL